MKWYSQYFLAEHSYNNTLKWYFNRNYIQQIIYTYVAQFDRNNVFIRKHWTWLFQNVGKYDWNHVDVRLLYENRSSEVCCLTSLANWPFVLQLQSWTLLDPCKENPLTKGQ